VRLLKVSIRAVGGRELLTKGYTRPAVWKFPMIWSFCRPRLGLLLRFATAAKVSR